MKANNIELGESGVYDGKTTIEREVATNDIVIKTDGVERVRIKDGGDVQLSAALVAGGAVSGAAGTLSSLTVNGMTAISVVTSNPMFTLTGSNTSDKATVIAFSDQVSYKAAMGMFNGAYVGSGEDFYIYALNKIRFGTGSVSAATGTDIIIDDGKLGIGNLSPAEKLDVTGNAKISGSATAGKIIETKTAQTIEAATDEVSCATSYVALDYETGGNITLTTNEIVDTSTAVDGQILHIVNSGADSVITLTCWVAATSEYSKVTAKDGATTIVLTRNVTAGKADGITLMYNSTVGRWLQVG